jgi:SAM-dependent methyltransferase
MPTPAVTTPGLQWVCPTCRSDLDADDAALHCGQCQVRYPVIAGIPDLRVGPDPWIGLVEDRRKALRLEAETAGLGLEDALRVYWAMTPETPPDRAARFIEHVLAAESRSRDWLRQVAVEAPRPEPGPWLDLGCGTADLAAAAGAGQVVIGADIAMRWLVLARKRAGLHAAAHPLVCCCAERLPFESHSVPRVFALGLLEHCASASDVLAEAARVLRPGGSLLVRTVNRYSVFREPHVGVWGVGFLPRRWADAYVRLWGGGGYRHHRPLSALELAAALRRAGLVDVSVRPAAILPADRDRLRGVAARVAPAYERLRRLAPTRWLLSAISPVLEARGTKP